MSTGHSFFQDLPKSYRLVGYKELLHTNPIIFKYIKKVITLLSQL